MSDTSEQENIELNKTLTKEQEDLITEICAKSPVQMRAEFNKAMESPKEEQNTSRHRNKTKLILQGLPSLEMSALKIKNLKQEDLNDGQ